MIALTDYYKTIVMILKGKTAELRDIPPERLDWSGSGAVLDLYEQTSGPDRGAMIQAMGQIIEEGKQPPAVIAQILHIATSLDIAQLEPSVKKLRAKKITAQEPLHSAVTNYLAFRKARAHR